MAKQYGLIIPNKKSGHQIGKVTTSKPSIFEEDSDSDSSELKPLKPTGIPKSLKKQDKLNQNKALEEDPTVYQYDEVYDEIDKKRKDTKLARKDIDKKPKYINRLLAAAEKRKRENERRIERQVQKEREEEGEMFKDKESFITSAYKKKLEEMKALEEQEKREEYLESIGDVRKQGNLDGFYRHLYEQKVKYEDVTDEVKLEIKEETKSDDEGKTREQQSDCESSPETCRKSESETELGTTIKAKKDLKNRKYRRRRDSKESEDSTEEKKEHLVSNLDADSDFSIDSSDSEDDDEALPEKKKLKKNKVADIPDEKKEETKNVEETTNDNSVVPQIETKKNKGEINDEPVEIKHKKPKVDIWKKRTVGEKFDEALKRYFERKSLREVQRGY